LVTREHLQAAAFARKNLAAYEKVRDLVNIGAYVKGSDAEADTALLVLPVLTGFLQQDRMEATPFQSTVHDLSEISSITSEQ
jgi:flagellum-specific ATP synthase